MSDSISVYSYPPNGDTFDELLIRSGRNGNVMGAGIAGFPTEAGGVALELRGDLLLNNYNIKNASISSINYAYYGNGTFEITYSPAQPITELLLGGGIPAIENLAGPSADYNARWLNIVDRLHCQVNNDVDVLVHVDIDFQITLNTGAGTNSLQLDFLVDFDPTFALGASKFLVPPAGQTMQISSTFLVKNWLPGGNIGRIYITPTIAPATEVKLFVANITGTTQTIRA